MSWTRAADLLRGPAPLVLIVPGLVAAAFVLPSFELQVASKLLIFAVLALGLDLLVGRAGLVSLGHAGFFAVGAYAFALSAGSCEPGAYRLPLAAGLAAAAAASGALALAAGLPALRTRGIYFLMVTLAIGQMVFHALLDIPLFGGSDGAFVCRQVEAPLLGGGPARAHFLLCVLVFAAMALLFAGVRASFLGRLLDGVRMSESRLGALGFPTFPIRLAAFALAGATAGLAGALEAMRFRFVNPELASWHVSGLLLVVVVLGGRNTLWGPVLGAVVVIGLEDALVERFPDHWRIGIGALAVAVALLAPDGVVAGARRLPGRLRRPGPVAPDGAGGAGEPGPGSDGGRAS